MLYNKPMSPIQYNFLGRLATYRLAKKLVCYIVWLIEQFRVQFCKYQILQHKIRFQCNPQILIRSMTYPTKISGAFQGHIPFQKVAKQTNSRWAGPSIFWKFHNVRLASLFMHRSSMYFFPQINKNNNFCRLLFLRREIQIALTL